VELEQRLEVLSRTAQQSNQSLEQRIAQRTADLEAANALLRDSRTAAFNLMEEAVLARRLAEETSAKLRNESAERMEAEAQLRELSRRLLEEAARKDDFLALLGHELRNPLAPIGYAVHLLRLGGQDPGLAERVCDIVQRQVGHLSRLVDELLDVSRITRGKIVLKREAVDLTELVRGVIADYQPVLEEHGLALEVSLPAEPLPLELDRTRMVQVVANLLHNASKFTDSGGRISVRASAGDGWVELSVRDSGTGIPPEQLGSIFEPFMQRKETIGRTRGGLGLGLALARGLAELHGGTLTARSDGPGRGSEFTVRLPDQRAAPRPPDPAGGVAPAGPRRILIVEDLADTATTLQLLLQHQGHAVAVAPDGRAALEAAERFDPDIVLCDIGLPGGLDGYAVARAMRGRPRGRRVHLIAMTGFGTPEDKRQAAQAGFDAHLTKPVDPAVLGPMLAGPAGIES
jgi:signal transduction histidine kinase